MVQQGMNIAKLQKRLDALLGGWVTAGRLPCVCAQIHRRGNVVYEGAFGKRSLESGKALRMDDIFRIYSMTKIFTSAAILMLMEEGRIRLRDPLSAFLPEYRHMRVAETDAAGHVTLVPAKREITLHHLLTMTAGIPYPGEVTVPERAMTEILDAFDADARAGKAWDTQTMIRKVAAAPLNFHPGEHWWYGYSLDVLGAVIEVATGKTLGDFFAERFFAPLGMKDTGFFVPQDKRSRLVEMYGRNETGTWTPCPEEMRLRYVNPSPFQSGGGGLTSTLPDVMRFADMMTRMGEWEGQRLLSRKSVELMALNHLTPAQQADFNWDLLRGYGYGLAVRTLMQPQFAGYGSRGEFGWSGMAGTWLAMDPAEGLSISYLVQIIPGSENDFAPGVMQAVYGAIED